MSHYLKLVMDAIFGRRNFRNEIVWAYSGPAKASRNFTRKHDIILFYSKSDQSYFDCESVRVRHKRQKPSGGLGMASGNRTLLEVREGEKEQIKRGKLCPDWWADIGAGSHIPKKERTGYRTQKPLALLRRVLQASSNKSDMILDPFCGCATTCIAAEELQRQWVGIDIGEKAADLVQMRMREHLGMLYDGVNRTDIPTRTDLGAIPHYKTHKKTLYGYQGGHCNGCSEHFKPQNLTVDHIIPRSSGGTDHLDNLQLLCGYCNSVKGNRGMEYLIARLDNSNTRRGYMR